MYPNLKAEFARQNLTLQNVADKLGVSVSTISMKMRFGGFTLDEAKQIKRDILKADIPIEILFEEAQECE